MALNLAISLLNLFLCVWQSVYALRSGRLISVVWILFSYFGLFAFRVAVMSEITWVRGFVGETVQADSTTITKALLYLLLFNLLFYFTDAFCTRFYVNGIRPALNWLFVIDGSKSRFLLCLLGGCLLIGGASYIWQMRMGSYRDYVEGDASWAVVFFWASAPIIVISAMLRRKWIAIICCLPFLYVSVHLGVRSFLLLSLLPFILVSLFGLGVHKGLRLWKMSTYLLFASLSLVVASYYISQYGKGGFTFPDSGMPVAYVQTMYMVDKTESHTGFSSLQLYGWNYINPFARLAGFHRPEIKDTPQIIASLLDGVPDGWNVYYHYPALIWADSYISFGFIGLLLAVFWGVILNIWEAIMARSPVLLSLLLPYYCWHAYMLVRGAIAGSTVPVSYSLYISLIAYILVFRGDTFKKTAISHGYDDSVVLSRNNNNLMN